MNRARGGWVVVLVAALTLAGCTSNGPTGTAATGAPTSITGTADRPETSATGSSGSTRRPETTATTAAGASGPYEDGGVPDLGATEIDVEHYQLDLEYQPDDKRLRSRTTIRVMPRRPLEEISLDYRGPDVREVTVNGEPATSQRVDQTIVIRPASAVPEGQAAIVVVAYEGTPEARAAAAVGGVHVGWHSESDGSFVLSEPDGASTFFPNNNHPRDKATYDITVTVPSGYTAIANGVLESQNELNGRTTFHWAMRQPMSSYLATVVTGRFNRSDQRGAAGVSLTNYVPDGTAPPAAFDQQGADLEMLVERLGPYPFDEYGAVQLPQSFFGSDRSDMFLSGAAFEAQGRSLFGSRSTGPTSVVHELAHQWMGDNVGVVDWSKDIWWVEGFAHYAEWVRDEVVDGRSVYDDDVEAARDEAGRFRRIGHRPPDGLFDEATYVGGALVFADLRAEVGDETFWRILRTFNERYRHSNASTDDLIAVANEVSGRDLDDFFASRLR